MKLPSVICLFVGLLGSADLGVAESRVWGTSVEEALTEAKEKNQLILVDLYADWCGWCKRLEKDVFSSPAFQEFARDFVLLRVDTEDGGEGTRLQEKYGAFSLPTTLLLDQRQVKIAEVRGFAPPEPYIQRIEQGIAAFEELERGFARFGQSADGRVLAILADEFHQRGDGERASQLYRRLLSLDQMSAAKEDLIRYQLTDALRLAGGYEKAVTELAKGRQSAARADNQQLVERFDLLAAQIALDQGDCASARHALEEFLGRHPSSDLRRHARRTLATLKADGFQCT